jgi:hypothetical protein
MATDINVTELDFSLLKENLKDFLSAQDEFTDYDFEGSGLQLLLNLLAYNSYNSSVFVNMIANEMFMDTAVLRESIISRSKELGYVPNSQKASKAQVSLTMIESASAGIVSPPAFINLPQYSQFTATLDGTNYIFTTLNSYTLDNAGTGTGGLPIYRNTAIDIYEGVHANETFTVNTTDPTQRFILSNPDLDADTIVVKVYPNLTSYNADSGAQVYSFAPNIVQVRGTDTVFWYQETLDGQYELIFGNGAIGRKLANGEIIRVDYLVTSGEEANNINTFSFADTITNYEVDTLTTTSSSGGGTEVESDANIRFSAPKSWELQNRSTTALDYQSLIEDKFPSADSVISWGGEDNDPPNYGKVYIALKPRTGQFITDVAKEDLKRDIIKQFNVVTVTPIIVDPVYTNIIIDSEIKYNLRELSSGETALKSSIETVILNFSKEKLEKFDSHFRYSNLTATIDGVSSAVKSNTTEIKLKHKLSPIIGTTASYEFSFNNSLKSDGIAGNLISTKFTLLGNSDVYFKDDGTGVINAVKVIDGVETKIVSTIGSVDSLTGKVLISNFNPSSIVGSAIDIIVKLDVDNFDVSPLRNQIFQIEAEDITITMNNISEQFLNKNNV